MDTPADAVAAAELEPSGDEGGVGSGKGAGMAPTDPGGEPGGAGGCVSGMYTLPASGGLGGAIGVGARVGVAVGAGVTLGTGAGITSGEDACVGDRGGAEAVIEGRTGKGAEGDAGGALGVNVGAAAAAPMFFSSGGLSRPIAGGCGFSDALASVGFPVFAGLPSPASESGGAAIAFPTPPRTGAGGEDLLPSLPATKGGGGDEPPERIEEGAGGDADAAVGLLGSGCRGVMAGTVPLVGRIVEGEGGFVD